MLLKFSKGLDNLDKLLGWQRMPFNIGDIGYNPFNKKKTYKNFSVQEASKNESHIICNYCLKEGAYISFMSS